MALLKKTGFPAEGELVMCTVTSVQFHSVFAQMDEYDKTGMIHISEVSPGRIRNIRDYVKEGKKIVCKVLRIKEDRGHIDLSLRRVTEGQKRQKIDQLKKQQNAEKIVEYIATQLKTDVKKLFADINSVAEQEADTLYGFFQEIINDEKVIDKLKLKDKEKKLLLEIVKQRVKPPQVELVGKLSLKSYASDGIEVVKNALAQAKKVGKDAVSINYLGSGMFKVSLVSSDYKTAEPLLKKIIDAADKVMEKGKGVMDFKRVE